MKKRILTVLCALALCLGLLSLSAGAVSGPCFMAVNDNLLPLEDQYIPIAVSGQYYVPYTVLDSSITGLELGIYPMYNATQRNLTIYNRENVLIFDLTSGVCTDRSGTTYSVRLVTRNGRIYVPARFTCEYFGLTYSTKTTAYGPMVRICSSAARLSDSVFIDNAQGMMETRLQEWRKSQNPADSPDTSPAPPGTVPPSPSPENPDVDKSDVRTYLMFQASQTDGLGDLLARLEQYQLKALFFFPAEELASYDGAVRQALCGGHAVGLLVTGTTAAETAAQAEEGKRLLAQIAHLCTNTILAPGLEGGASGELAAAGLLCLTPDVDARPDGRGTFIQAADVLNSAGQYSSQVLILSDASAAGAALMGRALPDLIRDRYDIRLALETEF